MNTSVENRKSLLGELGRLAGLKTFNDFIIDANQFDPREKELARLLKLAFENYKQVALKAAAEELSRTNINETNINETNINETNINEQLNPIIKIDSKIARWYFEIVGGDQNNPKSRFHWSMEYLKYLGFTNGAATEFPVDFAGWVERVHPDDQQMVLDIIAEHMEYGQLSLPYGFDFRMRSRAGEYRYFHSIAIARRDKNGTVVGIEGYNEDITNQKNDLRLLETVLDTLDTPIFISDMDTDEILFANQKIINEFYPDKNIIGQKCWECFHLNQTERCRWCKKGVLKENPQTPIEWEYRYRIMDKCYQKIDRTITWPGKGVVHIQQSMDITTMKKVGEEVVKREKTLDILNSLSLTLLLENKRDFNKKMAECIHLLSNTVRFHRMSIFRNFELLNGLHTAQLFRWVEQEGGATAPLDRLSNIAYSEFFPWWDKILATGRCINGPAKLMENAEFLAQFDLNSVLVTPILNEGYFWGFVLFENRDEEKIFNQHEEALLRSSSLILANAVIRNEEAESAGAMEERTRLMLDAMPLACRLWDKDYQIIECNEAVVKLYQLRNKKEYISRFFDLLPEYQPDGQKSVDKIYKGVEEAFEKGQCVYPIMFQLLDGTPLPAENILFRLRYGDEYVIAAYTRDMREQNRMIEEIAHTSARLEEALTAAKDANQAKSSFLAHMSHEIRTPMNAIMGIAEMLVQDEALSEPLINGLNRIYKAGNLLMGIINDILDFSKIEAGKLDIIPLQYSLASMVNDAVQFNIWRINSAIELVLEIDECVHKNLIGDELRIKQILNNLLSNAFKYTDTGQITLRVETEKKGEDELTLILSVQDTGHGMTQQQIKRLFDEYSRFRKAGQRPIEGTGLGMAITQRLISLMGGKIHVESDIGNGSLFVVRLPQGFFDDERLGDELVTNLRDYQNALYDESSSPTINRDYMPYGKVLVVDDMETNLFVAEGLLNLYGISVDLVTSGYDALEKIRAGNVYDIVFMDHMMPNMDGIEAVRHMRNLGYTEPIIVLTANAVVEQRDMFMQSGFDDFISKPIDMRQLDMVLNRFVRDKQPPEILAEAHQQVEKLSRNRTINIPSHAETPLPTRVVSAFLMDAAATITALETWLRDKEPIDFPQLMTSVHGLKSALANIGEITLSNTAAELENTGKNEDTAHTRSIGAAFLKELRALVGRLDLDKTGESDGEDEELDVLRAKFESIAGMCENFNRKGITDILDELEQTKHSRQTRLATQSIASAVLYSDYDGAAKIASSYAASLYWLAEKVEGVDIARGLEKCRWDGKTYHKILSAYANSLEKFAAQTDIITEDSLADYRIAVHGIKGESYEVYVNTLGRSAEKLENAANEGRLEYINKQQPSFRSEAQRISEDIWALLARSEARENPKKKDMPDAEVLKRLREACEEYDMNGVEAVMDEINKYSYESGGELVVWLREKVDDVDYPSIVQMLGGLDESSRS